MAHLTVVASGKVTVYSGARALGSKGFTFAIAKRRVLSLSTTLRKQWPERLRATSPASAGLATSDIGKTYYAQGVVKVQEVPVSRMVRVRRRDTGKELVAGMSGAGGRFHLSWTDYAGPVEVTIYDDAALLSPYNAKVFDFVTG